MGSDHRFGRYAVELVISIHAPAWGATATSTLSSDLPALFQSTLPHGERPDLNPRSARRRRRVISIHAPAWGATSANSRIDVVYVFQSTLPHGERQTGGIAYLLSDVFQSTLPHGERLSRRVIGASPFHFNPRSRMGSDRSLAGLAERDLDISIHAPAWGATACLQVVHVDGFISIHAPAWGATNGGKYGRERHPISIHAPAWGATHRETLLLRKMANFNPRSRMGSDKRVWYTMYAVPYFNPRSRMGSDPTYGPDRRPAF